MESVPQSRNHLVTVQIQSKLQRHKIGSLRVDAQSARGGEILVEDCLPNHFSQRSVLFLILCKAADLCRPLHHSGRSVVIAGSKIIAVCAAYGAVLRHTVLGQPVCEVEAEIKQMVISVLFTFPGDEIHPVLHHRIVMGQHLPVPEEIIHGTWQERHHVSPDTAPLHFHSADGGYCRAASAHLVLSNPQIVHVFFIESPGIHIIGCRNSKDVGIPCPAKALIPLGTVRGNIKEIALLTPKAVGSQPVNLWIR